MKGYTNFLKKKKSACLLKLQKNQKNKPKKMFSVNQNMTIKSEIQFTIDHHTYCIIFKII